MLRQVRPPSVLRRITPLPPTATQVLGRGQATPTRALGLRLSWRRQVRPPSVLRTIVPVGVLSRKPPPTATQVLALRQATPNRSMVVPLGWRRQVRPPSVLRTIMPPYPTATQVLGLG